MDITKIKLLVYSLIKLQSAIFVIILVKNALINLQYAFNVKSIKIGI